MNRSPFVTLAPLLPVGSPPRAAVAPAETPVRQVQVQVSIVRTTDQALHDYEEVHRAGAGQDAGLMLAVLSSAPGSTVRTITVTTSAGAQASASVWDGAGTPAVAGFQDMSSSVTVTPQIMPGGNLRVQLALSDSEAGVPVAQDVPQRVTTDSLRTTRTVPSGKTLVLAGLSPQASRADRADRRDLLFFVTPTLLLAPFGP